MRDVVEMWKTSIIVAGVRERVLAAGCDGYLSKPIDLDEFENQIQAFLAGAWKEFRDDSYRQARLLKAGAQVGQSVVSILGMVHPRRKTPLQIQRAAGGSRWPTMTETAHFRPQLAPRTSFLAILSSILDGRGIFALSEV